MFIYKIYNSSPATNLLLSLANQLVTIPKQEQQVFFYNMLKNVQLEQNYKTLKSFAAYQIKAQCDTYLMYKPYSGYKM